MIEDDIIQVKLDSNGEREMDLDDLNIDFEATHTDYTGMLSNDFSPSKDEGAS